MNYKESLEFLYSQTASYQREGATAFKKDLTNIRLLCDYLGNPQDSLQSIHVAGTNGKGSTSHILTSILMENKYTVGTFTSPHYHDFRERIRINGKYIGKKEVIEFIQHIKPAIERIQPSFYELTFAMSLWYFKKQTVDIAVIEVGLGGRLDSTNIIQPLLAIITNIGLDHQQFLGDTLEEIAQEKAGIIKTNTPVIIGRTQPETKTIFSETAKQKNAPLVFADQEYEITCSAIHFPAGTRTCTIKRKDRTILEITTDLVGDYQKENIRTAYCAVKQLPKKLSLTDHCIRKGLEHVKKNTSVFGRWEILGTEPLIIADSCHNEDAVRMFFEQLQTISYSKLHIIYGCVSDKNVNSIKQHFPPHSSVYLSAPDVKRKMPVEVLQTFFQNNSQVSIHQSVNQALKHAKQTSTKNDLIVITGSVFLIADLV